MKIQLSGLKADCLCAAVAILAVGTAHASTVTLSGYTATSDTVTGALLATHDYNALIQRLAPHTAAYDSDEVAASTDLCVAYAATHRLDKAHAACNEAVNAAETAQPGTTLADHQEHKAAVALALANQSVVDQMGR